MSIILGNNIKVQTLDVANEALYAEVADKLKVSPSMVDEMVKFVGQFTADIIKRGDYESVMIPNFGKFKIKPKTVTRVEQIRHKLRRDETINNGE
jgi:nucleoid DNA-binding protein